MVYLHVDTLRTLPVLVNVMRCCQHLLNKMRSYLSHPYQWDICSDIQCCKHMPTIDSLRFRGCHQTYRQRLEYYPNADQLYYLPAVPGYQECWTPPALLRPLPKNRPGAARRIGL